MFLGNKTRAPQGSKNVPLFGSKDTRLVTGTPFVTMSGAFLAFQVIFQGTTSRCIPKNASIYTPKKILSTFSKTHWSTEDTQKQSLQASADPYFEAEAREKQIPLSTLVFVLIIDCYSTHMSSSFVGWFKSRYNGVERPKGFLLFVPPGLTYLVQPADLTLQSKIKAILKQQCAFAIAKSYFWKSSKWIVDLRL